MSLGFLFLRGDLAEDAGEFGVALTCFQRGAAMGDVLCWTRLGLLYDFGKGVPVDKAEAMRCYREAWRRGREPAAAGNIAILYRDAGKRRRAFQWWLRAADAGDGDACLEVARCYGEGVGVRRSPDLKVRYLARCLAAEDVTEDSLDLAAADLAEARPRLV
jgi:TPR repeat protein